VILELSVVLGLDPNEFDELLELAGKPGLSETLAKAPMVRAFFRTTINRLSEEDW